MGCRMFKSLHRQGDQIFKSSLPTVFLVPKDPVAAAVAKLLQLCPTLWPHRRQPTRLPCPWDSPGKNTGVGCYFLLQCMKVKCESEVAQLCPTLSDSMDCSLPGSPIHGIFQARVLEWGAIAFSEDPVELLSKDWFKWQAPCGPCCSVVLGICLPAFQ